MIACAFFLLRPCVCRSRQAGEQEDLTDGDDEQRYGDLDHGRHVKSTVNPMGWPPRHISSTARQRAMEAQRVAVRRQRYQRCIDLSDYTKWTHVQLRHTTTGAEGPTGGARANGFEFDIYDESLRGGSTDVAHGRAPRGSRHRCTLNATVQPQRVGHHGIFPVWHDNELWKHNGVAVHRQRYQQCIDLSDLHQLHSRAYDIPLPAWGLTAVHGPRLGYDIYDECLR